MLEEHLVACCILTISCILTTFLTPQLFAETWLKHFLLHWYCLINPFLHTVALEQHFLMARLKRLISDKTFNQFCWFL